MITIEAIMLEFRTLRAEELQRWISNAWVRPERSPGGYLFHEIDLARIRLILELRDTLEVNEPALPTVLSLLDQLYEMRRQMRRLNGALSTVPQNIRTQLLEHLDHAPPA
jgi:chaperone modulatory protein CbpM